MPTPEQNQEEHGKIQIDKEIILVPKPRYVGHVQNLYPWRKLEVGGSFLASYPEGVEWGDAKASMLRTKIISAISHAGKRNGFRFVSRKLPEGIRVWRVQ